MSCIYMQTIMRPIQSILVYNTAATTYDKASWANQQLQLCCLCLQNSLSHFSGGLLQELNLKLNTNGGWFNLK
jgi:hypothetical protein